MLAGTIMEDVSVEAVSAFPGDRGVWRERLAGLKQASADIAALVAAAEVLDRRFLSSSGAEE
jgi:predicted secreted protein